jgi:signal transduction histidine kinase
VSTLTLRPGATHLSVDDPLNPSSFEPTPVPAGGASSSEQDGLQREWALARASALLVLQDSESLPEVLELMGKFADVDRSWLFTMRAGGELIDLAHEWCRPGIQPGTEKLQGLRVAAFPWWIARLSQGTPLAIESLATLPAEADEGRRILESLEVRSMLALPLVSRESELMGVMGFSQLRSERSWSREDIRALKLASGLVGREMERRRSMDAFRLSEERYRLAGLATRDLLYDWDARKGRVILAESDGEVAGYEGPMDVPLEWWLERIHPDEREDVEGDFNAAVESDVDHWESEYRFLRADDEGWAHIRDRGFFVRDPDGRVVRMVGYMSDNTEQKRLEEELRHSHKMKAVGALAGGMAHEFNNLLSVILGHAEFLMSEPGQTADGVEALAEIRSAAERGAALTRQLLAFGRSQVLRPRVVPVRDALHQMQKLLPGIFSEAIWVRMRPVLGDPRVEADPAQLEQVFLNLAGNARDAMPSGGVLTVTASIESIGEANSQGNLPPGRYVRIEFEDTGVGMDEETRSRAFEPFFSTKPAEEGAGLGLSTVYGIVQQLRGWVHLDSTLGEGTRVTLLLPAVES